MKKVFITGITGQDGSYLAEFLLSKGYEVHGLIRRASTFNTSRIEHLYVDFHEPGAGLFLHYGDLLDSGCLSNLIYNTQPDEIYHLGAQSHVRVSFDTPEHIESPPFCLNQYVLYGYSSSLVSSFGQPPVSSFAPFVRPYFILD